MVCLRCIHRKPNPLLTVLYNILGVLYSLEGRDGEKKENRSKKGKSGLETERGRRDLNPQLPA